MDMTVSTVGGNLSVCERQWQATTAARMVS